MKKKIALIPSAYNEAAMGDIENFIPYYKDDFDVYVIVDKEIKNNIETIDGVTYTVKNSPLARYVEATADYIIDAGTVSGNNKFSNSQKRVSVWHGIPYKKMFTDLGKEHVITALNYGGGMDLMVSPSKWYTDRFLRQSMLYEGDVLETAIARTDSLYINEDVKKSLREEFKIKEGKKILLYAPTYREPGVFKIPFSAKQVKTILGDEWIVMVKAHYLCSIDSDENVVDATQYPSINNLLAIADLVITDYSSVVFDYSILGKPGLFFQYDREKYENERSFMFKMEDYVEREDIIFNEERLYDRLKQVESLGDNLSKIRETFYPHQKENATAELVEKLNFDSTEYGTNEVVFLVNDLNEIGGVHSFVLNLSKQLKEKYGTKIFVFAINEYNRNKNELFTFDNDNLVDIKLSFEINPGWVRAILRATNGYIISCQYSAHKKFQRYIEGKKTVLMFHGDTKDIVNKTMYTWHLDSLCNKDINNYRRLAFLTEGNAKIIKDSLPEDVQSKIIAIPNGIDFSDGKNLYKKSGEFVFVGRLDSDKNPLELITIFSDKRLNPSYKLHIYGDGELREVMREKIEKLGMTDKILLHGYESDKETIYGGKQGLISTSLSEGFSLTPMEAIKYGLPIYIYDSFTACREIYGDDNGILIEPHDIKGFVEALNNPVDMKIFSAERIIKTFSNDAITNRWIRIFEELDEEEEAEGGPRVNEAQAPKTKAKLTIVQRGKRKLRRILRNYRKKKKLPHMPLVSIIMPFYNNNKTVKRAVESVSNCGYQNYELLLINDGSDEDPNEVIEKSSRIQYYYKENGGLSDTRNYGIDKANGKYVLFLDSDDTIYPNSLYNLINYAENNDLQMVCGKTMRYYVDGDFEEIWYKEIYKNTYINEKNSRNKLIDDTIATAKLYRTDMIRELGIRFKDGLYEDILFTGELYAKLDRIGIVKTKTQKWMVYGENTSITTKQNLNNDLARLKNLDAVFEMQTNELDRVYYTRQYMRHHAIVCAYGCQKYSEEEKRKLYEALKEGFAMRRPYIVDKLVMEVAKKELYRAILNDDYEKFKLIAEGYSAKHDKGIDLKEKKEKIENEKNEKKQRENSIK